MYKKVLFLFSVVLLVAVFALSSWAQDEPSYVGVKSCKMCHKGEKKGMIYETWEKTKHAQATQAIIDKGEGENELCLKCHSTGFGKGGYDPASEEKDKFAGVQCEACHGPGKLYKKMSVMKDREAAVAAGLIIPTEETCIQCHNDSHHKDMTFNFEEAWEKVKHELPEKAEAEEGE